MNPIATLSLAAALSLFTATAASAAVQLHPQVQVGGDTIRLGDLFEGTGDRAELPVAPAPTPGHPVVLDNGFLVRLARAHQLDWQPASADAAATITRASQTVGLEDIRGPVISALARRAVGGRLQVEFDNPNLQVVVPTGGSPIITIDNVYYSPNQNHFSADVVIGLGGPAPQRLTITGRAVLMVSMPVLVHRVNAGDIISRADIGWVEFNAAQVFGDIAASETDLLDRTPRRGLGVNTPINLHDLQAPRMVSRNQLVTMVLRTPSMLITTQGKAIQDGAKGEVIRIVNTQSNRTVDGTVTGPGQVSIAAPGSFVN